VHVRATTMTMAKSAGGSGNRAATPAPPRRVGKAADGWSCRARFA